MAIKYFICTRSQTDGSHIVHKGDCPFLPEEGKKIFIGAFHSPSSALMEGSRYFSRPGICPFCSKELHRNRKIPSHSEINTDGDFISSGQLKVTWLSALFCSVN